MATLAAATTQRTTSGTPAAYQSAPAQAGRGVRAELLADLLAEVGIALEGMPNVRLESAAAPLAAIATELVEQAELTSPDRLPIGDPAAPLAASLRTLAVLAARTARSSVTVDGTSATRVRSLLQAA